MGKDALLLIMLAEAVGLAALYLLLQRLAQFSKRTLDDVPDFLRQVNHAAIERLFDPGAEAEALISGNPRRTMRARLDLAREYVQNLHHNVTIVYQWGETEWRDMVHYNLEYDEDLRQRMLALHREAITFRVSARMALAKIWLLSVLNFDKWPLIPHPSVAALRRPGNVDLLQAYQRVKVAAAALAWVYGEEHSAEIETLM